MKLYKRTLYTVIKSWIDLKPSLSYLEKWNSIKISSEELERWNFLKPAESVKDSNRKVAL
jgi:hypothetical protein